MKEVEKFNFRTKPAGVLRTLTACPRENCSRCKVGWPLSFSFLANVLPRVFRRFKVDTFHGSFKWFMSIIVLNEAVTRDK